MKFSYKLGNDTVSYSALIKDSNQEGGIFDSAKSPKRQRRKRQSVTAKRAKSQTPKFV